jgi:uncharacterized protein (DUF2235 family)
MKEHTGKNIVICSDGTGNTAIKGRGTNVFKIFESVDVNGHRFEPHLPPQVSIYDDGVGTQSFKLLKIFSGAFGWGLGRNVCQLYKELCRIYDPNDRIYLFGFSRGAFTVRTLAGLITTCGIIDVSKVHSKAGFERIVALAYSAYRSRYRTDLMKWLRGPPDSRVVDQFRANYCHPNERIHFIGVWDTVDAVGLPMNVANVVNKSIYQFKFPNLKLSPRVDAAFHALSVDDERQSFHPLLWDQHEPSANLHQQLEQVWFAGVHSNVGGGYPKQGMSLVALDWIMHKAELAGLRLLHEDRTRYSQHANVDDKLYNPRSGLGTFYRWCPRDIEAMCEKSGVAPQLHLSVMERIAHGTEDYCPGNLPPAANIVFTPTGEEAKDRVARERGDAAAHILLASHESGRSLLARTQAAQRVGRFAYRIFLVTCAGLLAFAISSDRIPFSLSWSVLLDFARALLQAPWILASAVFGFALAWFCASYCDRSRQRTYSHFWFREQKNLRAALKRARVSCQTVKQPIPTNAAHVAVAEEPS